jgi:hypothetical protein
MEGLIQMAIELLERLGRPPPPSGILDFAASALASWSTPGSVRALREHAL